MKKLLIASTALSLAGGAAFAEMAVTVGGSAELGLDYNSEAGEGMSKHSFVHDFGVTFKGSGTTDGGLSFSASAGFDNKSGGGSFDDGSVSVSGSFGTLSIGDVARGIDMAGDINDVGMNDIGIDDMVEDLREGTAKQIRYGNTFGQISIAISAGTKDGSAAVAGTDAVVVPGRTIPGHTIPEVWTLGMEEANTYYLVGRNNALYLYTEEPSQGTYDSFYGVDRSSGIKIDIDGAEGAHSPSADMTGWKDSRDDDDERVTVDIVNDELVDPDEGKTGDYVLPDDGSENGVRVVSDVIAYNSYRKYYHFGDDGEIGGDNPAEGEDGDMDADVGDQILDDKEAREKLSDAYIIEEIVIPEFVVSEAVAPVPAVKSDTQYSFGMKFDAGGVTIGVGYDSEKTVSMGASFSAGEVSTNLLYVKTDDDTTGIGADMTYTMGASAVTLAYGRQKPEMGEAMDAVGMGVTHSLGGGATLSAGFGKVNEANKASIGIKFAF